MFYLFCIVGVNRYYKSDENSLFELGCDWFIVSALHTILIIAPLLLSPKEKP